MAVEQPFHHKRPHSTTVFREVRQTAVRIQPRLEHLQLFEQSVVDLLGLPREQRQHARRRRLKPCQCTASDLASSYTLTLQLW